MEEKIRLREIAKLFLKLGCIGFGGPAVHIAMMQQEVVDKRKWLTQQHFLDLVGATNLIPGPNSTEIAIHIGHEKRGWKGLIVAGLCFILPAVVITGLLAYFYKNYGHLPEIKPFIYGVQPAIISIILGAIFPLAKKSFKSAELIYIGIAVFVGAFFHLHEIYLMFGAGFVALLISYFKTKSNSLSSFFPISFFSLITTTWVSVSNGKLFFIFLKIGAILYGSGYVLFAFLDTELVATGLLSRQQLIDAITVGQFTPGPVFSSVTFVGYQINGVDGAVVSTIAIFLPSFLFVALLNPLVKVLRNSPLFSSFLDAINVASVIVIAVICIEMGKESISDWRTIFILVLSLVITFGFRKINSAFVVLGGSLVGFLLSLI